MSNISPAPWNVGVSNDPVNGWPCYRIEKMNLHPGEIEANRALIEAAPELLAACRALVAEFDYNWPSHASESGGAMAARAAIAKATGE